MNAKRRECSENRLIGSAAGARSPVAADVSRRILDDHTCLFGRPRLAPAATVRAPAPGPPTYVGGYELAWPCFGANPSRFPLPVDVFIIHHGNDFTLVRQN
jgi:hypothetical protein